MINEINNGGFAPINTDNTVKAQGKTHDASQVFSLPSPSDQVELSAADKLIAKALSGDYLELESKLSHSKNVLGDFAKDYQSRREAIMAAVKADPNAYAKKDELLGQLDTLMTRVAHKFAQRYVGRLEDAANSVARLASFATDQRVRGYNGPSADLISESEKSQINSDISTLFNNTMRYVKKTGTAKGFSENAMEYNTSFKAADLNRHGQMYDNIRVLEDKLKANFAAQRILVSRPEESANNGTKMSKYQAVAQLENRDVLNGFSDFARGIFSKLLAHSAAYDRFSQGVDSTGEHGVQVIAETLQATFKDRSTVNGLEVFAQHAKSLSTAITGPLSQSAKEVLGQLYALAADKGDKASINKVNAFAKALSQDDLSGFSFITGLDKNAKGTNNVLDMLIML